MALLFRQRQKTKESICELLRKAVHIAYGEVNNNWGKKEVRHGE